jgi:hypothetical protein
MRYAEKDRGRSLRDDKLNPFSLSSRRDLLVSAYRFVRAGSGGSVTITSPGRV